MANPLDLRRIRHLSAAVAEGSLTGAAVRLGLSQPALSASIKSLERELGVPLLRRHRSGVAPTRYADLLTSHATSIEAELDAAWSRLAHLKGTDSVSVRVGCGPSEATRLLPLALQQLRKAHPEVRVFVEYGLNEVLMPQVRRSEIAFALSSIPRSAADPDLFHETLHVGSAVVVARVGHPLARRRVVSVEDLQRYPWVLARQWELERKALDELFAEAGLKPVEPAIETTSAILMKTVVLQSDFLTFVPREMIHWEERADQLRPLSGFRSSWQRHVGITTRREETLAEPVRFLIAALRDAAAGLPER
jgi:DNA-binding transcriptional LysR family regulator